MIHYIYYIRSICIHTYIHIDLPMKFFSSPTPTLFEPLLYFVCSVWVHTVPAFSPLSGHTRLCSVQPESHNDSFQILIIFHRAFMLSKSFMLMTQTPGLCGL